MRSLFIIALLLLPASAQAALTLDSISYDPAIVAAGDEVDIVVQFHHEASLEEEERIGDPRYSFRVSLLPDDSVTERYITVMDSEGDDMMGRIVGDGYYNRKYRIQVMQNAVPGNYEFKLVGQWYLDGAPMSYYQDVRFTIPVKKEGISLGISNIISVPQKVRAGDKGILLSASIYNSGEKLAKNVRISLTYPLGITSSYTNDNQLYIGTIEPMQEKELQFYVDTERDLKESSYRIAYELTYQDIDGNDYDSRGNFPLVVKKKPDIVVVSSEGQGLAGDDMLLKVTVENRGEEAADAVDLRILKESSQPFEMDVRSSYLGEIKPGEKAEAVFKVHALRDAEVREHSLNVLIRARGDSEEGDTNVYLNTGSAKLSITGVKDNPYPLIGAVLLILIVVGGILFALSKGKRKR